MTVKVIGLIELQDLSAFEEYRAQVGGTVEKYRGTIQYRGSVADLFWNELACAPFKNFVELTFPSVEDARAWANSPDYQLLVPIRSKAMKLTLFSVEI